MVLVSVEVTHTRTVTCQLLTNDRESYPLGCQGKMYPMRLPSNKAGQSGSCPWWGCPPFWPSCRAALHHICRAANKITASIFTVADHLPTKILTTFAWTWWCGPDVVMKPGLLFYFFIFLFFLLTAEKVPSGRQLGVHPGPWEAREKLHLPWERACRCLNSSEVPGGGAQWAR